MTEYLVKATESLVWHLTKNNDPIGQIIYKNWFSFKSTIITNDNSRFQIEPKGIWGTTMELKNIEKTLLQFKMNWNGDIVIQTFFNNRELDFVIKQKGIFKSTFVLTDIEKQELLVIKPDINWSLVDAQYHIIAAPAMELLEFQEILILISIHCTNYYIAMISGVLIM